MQAQAERRAACCELVSEVARNAGKVRLKLTGTSMLPAMWPGDVVTVQRCQLTDLRPGHIVLYRAEGKLVAHRVIRTFPDLLVTRGDSVPHCDSPVDTSAIVGRVATLVRNHRTIPIKQTWRLRALSAILRRSHLCLRITLRFISRRSSHAPLAATFAPSETA
jgi:signal peptidase I